MKAIVCAALLALSVLAVASVSASAADEYDYPTNIFDKMQRQLP